MPAPVLFILVPMVAALGVYALRQRRWWRAEALAASAVTLGLAGLAIGLPLNAPPFLTDTFSVLGRTFVMAPVDRSPLAQIFGLAALMFVGAAMQPQGRYFTAAGLGTLGLLAAALLVRPFLFAAIFLELSAALAVFLLTDERHRDTRGALRFLTYATLGAPFILFAGWLVESGAASAQVLTQATLALAAGFALLLGVVPFHSWLPAIAESAPPLGTAFVTTVARVPLVFLALRFLDTYDWLAQNPAVDPALLWSGMAMIGLGALFVFGQQNLGRSVGYALIIECGALLAAVSLGGRAGIEVAVTMLPLHGLALWMWAIGLDQLRRAASSDAAAPDDFGALRGLGWRYPFAVSAVAFGLLSLVGLPLMAGFPARWALLRQLAGPQPALALLLLAAMTSVGVVVMRGLGAMTAAPSAEANIQSEEGRLTRLVYGFGIALVLLLGVFPQWLLPGLIAGATAFTRFAP